MAASEPQHSKQVYLPGPFPGRPRIFKSAGPFTEQLMP